MKGDTLLAGLRPDGHDGVKIRGFSDGRIEIALLDANGRSVKEISLSGIVDLETLGNTILRAVYRYKELPRDDNESYLASVRGALLPQVENHETALLNAK